MDFETDMWVIRTKGYSHPYYKIFNPHNEPVQISFIKADTPIVELKLGKKTYRVEKHVLRLEFKATNLHNIVIYDDIQQEQEEMKAQTITTKTSKHVIELTEKEVREAIAQFAHIKPQDIENIVINVKAGKVVGAVYESETSCTSVN